MQDRDTTGQTDPGQTDTGQAGRDDTWRALSDPVRRDILDLLRRAPRTTTELCGAFGGLSRFKVMNHMAALKDAGLIRVEKRGRERINHLDPDPLRAVYDDWLREYEVFWAGRLGRLKRVVEAEQRKIEMDRQTVPHVTLCSLEIARTVDIDAPAAAVFTGLTDSIGEWWGKPYLQNEDAIDIVLEARPGGLLAERTVGGDGAVWATVQEVRRDRLLVLEGRMNMRPAAFARTRFELEPLSPSATRLRFASRALGEFTARHHDMYGGGWGDLLGNRLKGFVERGDRVGIRAGR